MSAFRALKDVSKKFEEELRCVSNELFSAKIGESFEDKIAKKISDLSVYNAKLRLLRAKTHCINPQVSEQDRDEETTLEAYGEAVSARIIEQQLVKSTTQAQAVKNLITAPDSTLNPEMVERKKKILAALAEYRMKEGTVLGLDTLLKEKEGKLAETRELWDSELGLLRDMKGKATQDLEMDINDALYKKLSTTVNKLELMRWLAGQLGAPYNCGYDWLTDPHRLLKAIKLARGHYTVEQFLDTV